MKKKKWRDVKNALVMVIVMAAMLSTATYAWFTLTSNATVTGMQMTAGGSSGLKVSKDGTDGSWKDAIDLTQKDENDEVVTQVINQVTIKNSDKVGTNFVPTFYAPKYGDVTTAEGTKTGVAEVTAIESMDLTNYVAKYEYYLKTESDSSANVGITIGAMPDAAATTGLDSNGDPVIDGSFVRATDIADRDSAALAVRIGIVVDGKMYIYEPNSDGTIADGKKAPVSDSITDLGYTPDVKSIKAGTIVDNATPAIDGTSTSQALFNVTNAGTKVTMYVWLEGTDEQCVDQIKADEIEAQVQFTIISE